MPSITGVPIAATWIVLLKVWRIPVRASLTTRMIGVGFDKVFPIKDDVICPLKLGTTAGAVAVIRLLISAAIAYCAAMVNSCGNIGEIL